jgi:hypothetical protein
MRKTSTRAARKFRYTKGATHLAEFEIWNVNTDKSQDGKKKLQTKILKKSNDARKQ